MIDIGAQGGIVGTVLGMMTADYNDNRQIRQQQKLTDQQMLAARDMARFQQKLAMENWENTNYPAQRAQMEKAGLNVGLMYSGGAGGGAGGITSPSIPMPTGAQAPVGGGEIGMGLEMGLRWAMMQSQKKNIDADTRLKNADADKTEGVDTEKTGSEIENIKQNTQNLKVQQTLDEYQADIAQVEVQIKQRTKEDAIEGVKQALTETAQRIRSARVGADVAEATKDTMISQLKQNAVEQALRIKGQQKGLIKQDAEIESVNQGVKKMAAEINRMATMNLETWNSMSNKDKELQIQKMVQEISKQNSDFQTSTPQQISQWVELIGDAITLGILKF